MSRSSYTEEKDENMGGRGEAKDKRRWIFDQGMDRGKQEEDPFLNFLLFRFTFDA